MKLSAIFLFWIAPLLAQLELHPPTFGCLAGRDGRLRALHGARASLVASPPMVGGVQSALCNARFTLYKSGSTVALLTRDEKQVLPGSNRSLIALDENWAVTANPETGELHYWDGGSWRISPARVEAHLLALRVATGTIIILSSEELKTISIVNGAVESRLPVPILNSPVVLLSDGSILTIVDSRWTRWTESAPEDLGQAPPGIVSLEPLHKEWFAARMESGSILALRVGNGHVESFLLPGSSEE